jgi:inward rectifier potassium channel
MKRKPSGPKYPGITIGESSFVKLGLPRHDWGDIYHALLTLSWPRFLVLACGFFVLANAAFALAYLAQDGGIENARNGSFADAFFFSVETMATVGYGAMHPVTLYSHMVSTAEILAGMLGIAMMTGLMFARFSRPTARVIFSRTATVHPVNGIPTLTVRAANRRHNSILQATVRATLLRHEATAEGQAFRRFHDLKLVRDSTPVFALSLSVMHPIDGDSPLHGVEPERLGDMALVVSLSGFDETSSQTVHARQFYYAKDIHWGKQFADIMLTLPDGRQVIDFTRFHDFAP